MKGIYFALVFVLFALMMFSLGGQLAAGGDDDNGDDNGGGGSCTHLEKGSCGSIIRAVGGCSRTCSSETKCIACCKAGFKDDPTEKENCIVKCELVEWEA